jgi:hypothetical protein
VRPLVLLLALVVAAAACGSADPAHTPLAFGVGGGNMVPYQVTIQPNGFVRHSGSITLRRRHLAGATVRRLRSEIQSAGLRSRNCTGTLPDVGSTFIRVGKQTWTVHGACDPKFTRVWKSLAHAVGLRIG